MDNIVQSKMTVNGFGDKVWKLNDRIHREDGPAQIYKSGAKAWWIDGKIHRTDGPAIELPDGDVQWWWGGNYAHFDDWLKKNDTLSEEEKVMFKLQYG
jgi:hypothetical protein